MTGDKQEQLRSKKAVFEANFKSGVWLNGHHEVCTHLLSGSLIQVQSRPALNT